MRGGTGVRGRQASQRASINHRWDAAERSGHRYARGRNAANYRAAGEALLTALAPRYGFDPGTPAFYTVERAIEHHQDREHLKSY